MFRDRARQHGIGTLGTRQGAGGRDEEQRPRPFPGHERLEIVLDLLSTHRRKIANRARVDIGVLREVGDGGALDATLDQVLRRRNLLDGGDPATARESILVVDLGAGFARRPDARQLREDAIPALLGVRALVEHDAAEEHRSLDTRYGPHRDGGDVLVVDGQEIVAVLVLAAEGEIRRSAVDDRVVRVEAADDEFMVNLMTESDAAHLIERRRKDCVDRFPRDQHALLGARGVKDDALWIVRDAVAEDLLVFVDRVQRVVDGALAVVELHHCEQNASGSLRLRSFLLNAIGDCGEELRGVIFRVRREGDLHLRRESGGEGKTVGGKS